MGDPSQSGRYDVAVIGGGVVGCAVLRAATLAGYRAVLLERGADILSGASKGNSAILHTGFDAPQQSVELAMMQSGRRAYVELREAMNLPLLETDAILVAWNDEEAGQLPAIVAKAHANGVITVRPMGLDELKARHPHVSASATAALMVPGEHVIDPWSAPLAYATQAVLHGAEILRRAEVTGADRIAGAWRLRTRTRAIEARVVVNCAGNFGDFVEALGGMTRFRIRPRKGQFVVFDKTARRYVDTIVLPVPTERTKGVLVCPTVFGNVLAGPTAEDQEDRERAEVDRDSLLRLVSEACRVVPALATEPLAATYAGLRPASDRSDYILEALPEKHWITVAGIRSTGLTAALGIGAHVAELIEQHFIAAKPVKTLVWPRMPNLAEHLPRDHERAGRGSLVCFCENVTRDEIEAALSSPVPAGDLGGLKRRTRALMGPCQGFNCLAAVCAIAGDRLLEPPPVQEIQRAH